MHGLGITGDAVAGEGLRHDPSVRGVFVAVEQHQAAVEERSDEHAPSGTVDECAVAVLQGGAACVGPEEHHPRVAGEAEPRHRSVLAVTLVVGLQRITHVVEGVPDVRQSLVARDRSEPGGCGCQRLRHSELHVRI